MLNNKWMRGAVPALFLHSCIGSVYCWSLLKGDIATEMGVEVSRIEFAFSLAIFFLGMSAAIGGRFVEKAVKLSSLLSCFCFATGLFCSVWAIKAHSVVGLMLSYGCLMGIGLGLGYLSPVKTLMLWFSRHKGLATGIAISGFGLSKVLFSPFIEWCNVAYGVQTTLASMACISIFFMLTAALLIRKPEGWVEKKDPFSMKAALAIITDPTYIKIWIIFYLNITCGLAIISFEKNLALLVGITSVGLLSSATAVFNTVGRFGYSSVSDFMRRKEHIYIIIFASSALATISCSFTEVPYIVLAVILLCVVNAGYGGGFSTLPTLLFSKFGMEKISTIHGFALSAWAWAGMSGNQLTNLIVNIAGGTYQQLFWVLSVLYLISLGITINLRRQATRELTSANGTN
ncbi:MAG: MFS transporter [Bacteroidales bacterium]|nr:MFS transporter [Bacteroidales bacterium]